MHKFMRCGKLFEWIMHRFVQPKLCCMWRWDIHAFIWCSDFLLCLHKLMYCWTILERLVHIHHNAVVCNLWQWHIHADVWRSDFLL